MFVIPCKHKQCYTRHSFLLQTSLDQLQLSCGERVSCCYSLCKQKIPQSVWLEITDASTVSAQSDLLRQGSSNYGPRAGYGPPRVLNPAPGIYGPPPAGVGGNQAAADGCLPLHPRRPPWLKSVRTPVTYGSSAKGCALVRRELACVCVHVCGWSA